jgi:hypothetical protein
MSSYISITSFLSLTISDIYDKCQKCSTHQRVHPKLMMFPTCYAWGSSRAIPLAHACCCLFRLGVVEFPRFWFFGIRTWSLLLSTFSLKPKSHRLVISIIRLQFSNNCFSKSLVKMSAVWSLLCTWTTFNYFIIFYVFLDWVKSHVDVLGRLVMY